MSRLRRLHPIHLWAFARAWTVLLAADMGLRACYPLRGWSAGWRPALRGRAAGEPAVGRLVWATEAAARHHLYPMRCLPRALCLRWLLGRHGIAAELRIGVAPAERAGSAPTPGWSARGGRWGKARESGSGSRLWRHSPLEAPGNESRRSAPRA